MHTNEQPQITDTYTLNTWTLIHAVHTCTYTDKPTIIHSRMHTHIVYIKILEGHKFSGLHE